MPNKNKNNKTKIIKVHVDSEEIRSFPIETLRVDPYWQALYDGNDDTTHGHTLRH